MKEEKIITCPSCNEKLRMRTTVRWSRGYVRCPICGNRVFVSLDSDSKQKKKQH